jgi:polyhydroxyalkanoate synthesis regulator phasin
MEKGKLTKDEARRAFGEMIQVGDEYSEESEHYLDVAIALDEEERKNKILTKK